MVTEALLFVEGGGVHRDTKAKCRKGFRDFIENAGMIGNMPRIVPCGSRNIAFEKCREAVLDGKEAVLLVDSEGPVQAGCERGAPMDWTPWIHLKYGSGDGWDRPGSVSEVDCNLMVECMECWFFADRETHKKFFGKKFMEGALPSDKKPPESVGKDEALAGLEKATRGCVQNGSYSKGKHSFELLAAIDSSKVFAACPWASRFLNCLEKRWAQERLVDEALLPMRWRGWLARWGWTGVFLDAGRFSELPKRIAATCSGVVRQFAARLEHLLERQVQERKPLHER